MQSEQINVLEIRENFKKINAEIIELAKKRTVVNGDVQIIAVTKTQSVEKLKVLQDEGIRLFAENRVQEALTKKDSFNDDVKWHLIGHLQTNKAKIAVKNFEMIQSVDSIRLTDVLQIEASKIGKKQKILLQVNVADEESKFGVKVHEVIDLVKYIDKLPNIILSGLMNIAPFFEDTEKVRPIFQEMFKLFKKCQELALENADFKWLSMGMTNDYKIAVEEGANMLRIGSGIFGTR